MRKLASKRTQPKKSHGTTRSLRAIILMALLVTNILAFGQGLTSQHLSNPDHSSLRFSPLKSKRFEDPYRRITPSERLRWLPTGTIGPAHMAGVGFVSPCGTAIHRPGEYGSHWGGFGSRFGRSAAGSAVGNAFEIGIGLSRGDDPRYFQQSQEAVQSRIGHLARLTFLARGRDSNSHALTPATSGL